jgi:hypothetical protein
MVYIYTEDLVGVISYAFTHCHAVHNHMHNYHCDGMLLLLLAVL